MSSHDDTNVTVALWDRNRLGEYACASACLHVYICTCIYVFVCVCVYACVTLYMVCVTFMRGCGMQSKLQTVLGVSVNKFINLVEKRNERKGQVVLHKRQIYETSETYKTINSK